MLMTRQASAAVRYNTICILFLLLLATCMGTFLYELAGASPSEGPLIGITENSSRMAYWVLSLGSFCSKHAVLIVWGWLFVFTVKSLHLLGGYLYSQRVRHYGVRQAPRPWQERVDLLCRQLGIRRTVQLVESQIVKMPLVVGHLRPVILMPLGLIMGLPEGEIEAVLLHELAHIRRNDYIVNFIQNIAVNLFFFNPGLLWMSSLLREEREHCCDDIAIARTHDRAEFIRALIRFKEYDLRLRGVATAFPGRKDRLVKRVMRIAQHTNKTLDPAEKVFLAVSFILISVLVTATSGNSSTTLVKVSQIPGGKYRFIVDTPMRYSLASESSLPELPAEMTKQERMVHVDLHENRTQENDVVSLIKDNEVVLLKEKMAIDAAALAAQEKLTAQIDEAQARRANEQQPMNERQVSLDKELAERAEQQAVRDRDQADRDKEQALRDKEQADLDAQQAIRDKEQAVRDKEQVIRDKKQADRDALQALLDKAQAERDAKQPSRDAHPPGN
jgi:beta-lactamase regulating signal transducer with metallopeptidase domain